MTNIVNSLNSTNSQSSNTRSTSLSKRDIMTNAHALASTFEGDYSARLALALKEIYSNMKRVAKPLKKVKRPRKALAAQYRFVYNEDGDIAGDRLSYEHNGLMWHFRLDKEPAVQHVHFDCVSAPKRYEEHLSILREEDFRKDIGFILKRVSKYVNQYNKGNKFAKLAIEHETRQFEIKKARIELAEALKSKPKTAKFNRREKLSNNVEKIADKFLSNFELAW